MSSSDAATNSDNIMESPGSRSRHAGFRHESPGSRHAGFRQGAKSHEKKERVIRYHSPKKNKDAAVVQPDALDGSLRSFDECEYEATGSTNDVVDDKQDSHPQKVKNAKFKPLKEEFMSYYSSHSSISRLSFNVNDAAGGKDFESCYEKQEVLGEGGFAVVYRCFHYERMHTYAVKEILKYNYEGSGENLKEEIDALKRLRDIPYIVRLMDVFHEPDVCYVVMEEMHGGDLLERLGDIEVFNETEGRTVTRRLLDAVFYCHRKNIVHRDIKPENILMSSRENNTSIKLADFGCSRRFEPGTNDLFTLCGSPQYVAPELYTHGADGYDERCDLWSAAVVIYVILGGYAPFDGEDEDLPHIICDGSFVFHDDYWAEVSEPAKDVIRSLLQVDPMKRATLEDALDSEWLRRRDRDKLEISKNLDASLTTFEAWCKSQNSDGSGNQWEIQHSSRRASMGVVPQQPKSSDNDLDEDDITI